MSAGAQTVLLVEDHELVRFGLKSLLAEIGGRELRVLEAGSLHAALRIYAEHAREIALVILDLNLGDIKGLAALREFRRLHAGARIVVLSGSVDDAISGEALALGAEAFLHKTQDVRHLSAALTRCVHGLAHARMAPPSAAQSKRLSLSPRELEILDLVLQGCSNLEIVEATGLKLGTVKNYVSGLLVVFGVASRTRLLSLFQ